MVGRQAVGEPRLIVPFTGFRGVSISFPIPVEVEVREYIIRSHSDKRMDLANCPRKKIFLLPAMEQEWWLGNGIQSFEYSADLRGLFGGILFQPWRQKPALCAFPGWISSGW